MKEKILQLRNEGKSYNTIVNILGCSKGIIAYHCSESQHYKTLSRNTTRRKKLKQWVDEYKKSLKCIKCGNSNPIVLDFHHRDPDEKDMTISKMVNNFKNKELLLHEINKCDILCSNCHRIVHYNLNRKKENK